MKPAITCAPGCDPLASSRYVAYPRRMKRLTKQAKAKAREKLTYQERKTRHAQHKHEVSEEARKPGQTRDNSAVRQRQSGPLTARGALPSCARLPSRAIRAEPGPLAAAVRPWSPSSEAPTKTPIPSPLTPTPLPLTPPRRASGATCFPRCCNTCCQASGRPPPPTWRGSRTRTPQRRKPAARPRWAARPRVARSTAPPRLTPHGPDPPTPSCAEGRGARPRGASVHPQALSCPERLGGASVRNVSASVSACIDHGSFCHARGGVKVKLRHRYYPSKRLSLFLSQAPRVGHMADYTLKPTHAQ